jgi:hypothetical protein
VKSIVSKINITPNSSRRRNLSTNIPKPKTKYQSPEITRPGSVAPFEVQTFLQENDIEKLTDDWSVSLLYMKISEGSDLKLLMSEQDMTVVSRKPPRDATGIKTAIEKGIKMLRMLLLELLGTKEDMERFEIRFNINSTMHVRALMEKCLNLYHVRNLTIEVLKDIHKRESIIKNLEKTKNKIKEKVLKVFSMNKDIREKIKNWVGDESVPFNVFIFKKKDYLQKISEDNIILQEYLSEASTSCMRSKKKA